MVDIPTTTEHVIGTWTNGKPIYEKTYLGKTSPTTSSNDFALISDLNIDEVIWFDGIFTITDQFYRIDHGSLWQVWITVNSIRQKTAESVLNADASVTLRYTKTTD